MLRRIKKPVLILLLALPMFAPVAAAPDVDWQRQRFLEVHDRIMRGQAVDVETEIAALQGYVLAPYLEYFYLQRRLAAVDKERVAAFLTEHQELPVAGQLRGAYLQQLARRGRWRDFEQFYQPTSDAELQCHQLRARLERGAVDRSWLKAAEKLWLVGRSQPAACDPVFVELYERDAVSADKVWERVTLLIEGGNVQLAESFRKHLDPARREWLEHWLAGHRRPRQVLERPSFPLVGPFAAQVVTHALRRLGAEDPAAALDFLAHYERGDLLSPAQKANTARDIALRAAYSQDPRALAWLDALPPGAVTDNVRLWTARMALRTQNWPRLLEAIAALPSKENQTPQWSYWRAHALAATGQQQEAQTEFMLLALERHYYGFLAADRLALPYNLNHVATAIAAEVQAQVAVQPGIVRAREFFQLGLLPEARREWQAAILRLNRAQQGQAAMLALQWGWYDRAVLTANQAGLSDDLDLRFPTPYRDRVERYSRMHRLDPHVTYAIVRQESAFRPDATSRVGALGLMQMMPQTGRQVAKRLSVEPPSRDGLLDVDTNLKFGSAYLRTMLDQYNGNLVLAAAAYNAGPRRVADWLERNADLPPTVWIEAISFHETREYVKSILAFAAVFNWRLNGESGRLSEYLLPFGREPGCTAATTANC